MEHQEETHKLIQEATELALILSRPGNAGQAQKAQALLQDLQKSPAGWVIADGLLGNDEADIRFYGALTLTMKIHQDWQGYEYSILAC
ncbi:member of the karyopherin-beta [Ophidiomyces ophidiicola]|nr:member of the karyopherin-beta [Ophidiomyces ophidiicola]KAI1983756.1 member of the karyopherin-beta [Ophidiomyces ophidiicola]KAI1989887.1 member of the karyopherin-beta [Ophidiomyces ophidiicola]KAI2001116.1 member of the karyopherin-beta [Ophidiomyces ophidiicola]